jgi:hypothetical protein
MVSDNITLNMSIPYVSPDLEVLTIDAGDQLILIGEIIDIKSDNQEPPLYHKRKFGIIPEDLYS